jgi:hypothetical protein
MGPTTRTSRRFPRRLAAAAVLAAWTVLAPASARAYADNPARAMLELHVGVHQTVATWTDFDGDGPGGYNDLALADTMDTAFIGGISIGYLFDLGDPDDPCCRLGPEIGWAAIVWDETVSIASPYPYGSTSHEEFHGIRNRLVFAARAQFEFGWGYLPLRFWFGPEFSGGVDDWRWDHQSVGAALGLSTGLGIYLADWVALTVHVGLSGALHEGEEALTYDDYDGNLYLQYDAVEMDFSLGLTFLL